MQLLFAIALQEKKKKQINSLLTSFYSNGMRDLDVLKVQLKPK